jgi:protein-S-isoprenylcysteine O-methyltransferase Ste14
MNWVTTGDHLIKTIFTDTYWAVAGVDLSLIATALIAIWAARKLGARAAETVKPKRKQSAQQNKQVNAYD